MKTLLVIGLTFPEPTTTAAGSRMMQLLDLFLEENYKIIFASTATVSPKAENLEAKGISIKNILLNDPGFDVFIKKLNPALVFFDRFITEEQFGWRVAEHCPNALKLLDTQDLHFVRKAREEAIKKGIPVSEANLFNDTAKRELASILRCDLSLIISEYEMDLLQNVFRIPSALIYYLPFLVENISGEEQRKLPTFKERNNFITLGNFLHTPNVDAVFQLKEIWPSIRKKLPQAELHIYGAYAPQKIHQLHNEREGFLLKGWAPDAQMVMKQARVQLAFLRFGAGLKGKLLDAMLFGTPSVSTKIGAEGMYGELPFAGVVAASTDDFINASVQLYSEEKLWNEAQQNGFSIIEKRFSKFLFSEEFKRHIKALISNLEIHRQQNFIGQILQHHTLQSSKYMSKWIEAKNSGSNSNVCLAQDPEVRKEYRE